MSWLSPLRVLGVCGVWLAVQAGCGGNPTVSNGGTGTDGGTSSGGTSTGTGAGGSFVIGAGGEGDSTGEGGAGDAPAVFVCGNQELEPGEYCDDGNQEDGDGCSGDCKQVNPDFDCSAVGEPCVQVVICGNGVLEGEEACDDGNTSDDDGCSFDCGEVEEGWVCIRPGKECVEKSVCGNGKRERGEACDDGNAEAEDGCDALCQVEPAFYCPIPGEECVQQECGDGRRVVGEACDDGNVVAGDGCSADCKSVEPGWHCNVNGCKPECGDGVKNGPEGCDDGNAIGGDGCSAACKVEPYFTCAGAPSVCSAKTPAQLCGNNVVDPIFSYDAVAKVWKVTGHEVCDPPSVATGCNSDCAGVTVVMQAPVCGNEQVEGTETCDPPDGVACKACQVQPGYTCPQAGFCFANPACGDGTLNTGEACDDGNKVGADGCSATCTVEGGYTCVGLGPSVCVKPVCGNGTVESGEQCDDGNAVTTDGCNACKITNGWACPSPGAPCIPKCGDGVLVAGEACDDGNKVSGDGCNTGCKVEPGFKCPTPNQKCVESVCGDNKKDEGEGCDDGNKVAGDGCGPTCQPEPTVTVGTNPKVNVFCGDGLKTGSEECDDGNTNNGDGCESNCKETPGWTCSAKLTLPKSLDMRVTYRDFKSANASAGGGHPDFQYNTFGQVRGITGSACTSATADSCGRLDADGKPVLIRTGQQNNATGTNTGTGIMSANTFGLWYRSTNPNNVAGYNGAIQISPFTKTLTLGQEGNDTSEVYSYSNGNFYPLAQNEGFGRIGAEVPLCNADNAGPNTGVLNQAGNCGGCNGTCQNRNYGFTSELRYFFQYKGGERLSFTGDDDVWVYVNGKLAVDLGGLHQELSGQVVLGDDGNGVANADSNCSAHGVAFNALPDPAGCYSAGEASNATDDRFGLTKGGVYEIVLFHAERHSSASNFRLTLAGFLAPRSFCTTLCGDGVIAGTEFCDDGPANSDSASGACKTDCTARNYCGDGVRQTPGEACDNGINTDLYKTAQSAPSVCAPGCKVPASCGDGALQAGFEQCDKGAANKDDAYGKTECKKDCQLGGYCGDAKLQAGHETCDLGANNGKTYGPNSCGYDCKPGRRCGDGIINDASEKCDDGAMNGAISSHCSVSCTIVPYCGDGEVKSPEQCDYGQFNEPTPDYGGCSSLCTWGPRCGDGAKDPEEECDDGAANSNDGTYDGCTLACTLGPRCGDGVKQASQGEACDNGFNEDDYDDPSTPQEECGRNCQPPPFCGDKVLQPAYELCDEGAANDDDAYEGCTTTCEFGPFCGDGVKNGKESCDKGSDNVAYAAKKGGCGYDCQPAPYCGDGERNGPEQCDLGTDKNTGAYGTCNPDCTFAPRCGDKKVDKGEQCDDGPAGSLTCLPSCKLRAVIQ